MRKQGTNSTKEVQRLNTLVIDDFARLKLETRLNRVNELVREIYMPIGRLPLFFLSGEFLYRMIAKLVFMLNINKMVVPLLKPISVANDSGGDIFGLKKHFRSEILKDRAKYAMFVSGETIAALTNEKKSMVICQQIVGAQNSPLMGLSYVGLKEITRHNLKLQHFILKSIAESLGLTKNSNNFCQAVIEYARKFPAEFVKAATQSINLYPGLDEFNRVFIAEGTYDMAMLMLLYPVVMISSYQISSRLLQRFFQAYPLGLMSAPKNSQELMNYLSRPNQLPYISVASYRKSMTQLDTIEAKLNTTRKFSRGFVWIMSLYFLLQLTQNRINFPYFLEFNTILMLSVVFSLVPNALSDVKNTYAYLRSNVDLSRFKASLAILQQNKLISVIDEVDMHSKIIFILTIPDVDNLDAKHCRRILFEEFLKQGLNIQFQQTNKISIAASTSFSKNQALQIVENAFVKIKAIKNLLQKHSECINLLEKFAKSCGTIINFDKQIDANGNWVDYQYQLEIDQTDVNQAIQKLGAFFIISNVHVQTLFTTQLIEFNLQGVKDQRALSSFINQKTSSEFTSPEKTTVSQKKKPTKTTPDPAQQDQKVVTTPAAVKIKFNTLGIYQSDKQSEIKPLWPKNLSRQRSPTLFCKFTAKEEQFPNKTTYLAFKAIFDKEELSIKSSRTKGVKGVVRNTKWVKGKNGWFIPPYKAKDPTYEGRVFIGYTIKSDDGKSTCHEFSEYIEGTHNSRK